MSQMNYNSPAIKRLGIPKYTWWNECLHGVARSGVATEFPQAIGMAASFNTDLMYEVASAISDEARAKYNEYIKFGGTEIYQGLAFCAPNINISRDPRWGRGHETYGEDPCLTGRMGVAFIKGLQGDGKYRKCDATLKHFAVHSGPEATRHGFNVDIDDEILYSTYLAAFEYCIKNADPSSVMGAYNAVNGEPCTASKTLLIDILRNKFGFEGYIESDAGGVEDINNYHKLISSLAEGAAMSVNNGCDLCIGSAYESLPEAYEKGYISEATLTKAVERLFTARFRLGMFDDYSMKNRTYKFFEGEPLFEFGFGLTYSTITENWIDENTVEIENIGNYDTDYSVLKFEYVPHKTLTDFKKMHIHKGEKKTIKF